jgi:hypothetical protein
LAKKQTPHYYRILGLVPDTDNGLSYVVRQFVLKLKSEAAMLPILKGVDLDESKRRIYDLVEAVRVISAPGRCAEYDELGHDAWMFRHPAPPALVETVAGMDWLVLAMEEIENVAADVRSGTTTAFNAMLTSSLTDILKLLPGHIRGDRLTRLTARDMAEEMLSYVDPDEKRHRDRYGLAAINPDRIRWVWQTTHSETNGRIILGTCKALGKRDRALQKRKEPYLWEITLSLDYWLVATDQERKRLVHHELAHCCLDQDNEGNTVPKVRCHSIEEMLSTMLYFGPLDETQSAVVSAANLHPSVQADQPALFPTATATRE